MQIITILTHMTYAKFTWFSSPEPPKEHTDLILFLDAYILWYLHDRYRTYAADLARVIPGFLESSYSRHNTGDMDEPEYNEHIHETVEGMEDFLDLSDHDQPHMQMEFEDDNPFLSSPALTPNLQNAAHIHGS